MKESMLDVLMYLFEYYMDENLEVSPDQEALKGKLLEAGFLSAEINKAFSWLEGLARQRDNDAIDWFSNHRAIRIYTPMESKKLDMECRGFLLFLEQTEVLTPNTRELVIDRAMALEAEEIDLDQFKWVILMVLFNQPGHEAAFAWVEDFVFNEMTDRDLH